MHRGPRGDTVGEVGGDRLLLDPEPRSVALARRWLREALADWSPAASSTAMLLVSELVTNAVLHARTPIEVRLHRDGTTTRVDVTDSSVEQQSTGSPPEPWPAEWA